MHLPAILQFEAATILPRIRGAAKFIFWGNPEIYMAELAGRPCFPRSTPPSVHPGKATHRYTSSGGNGWTQTQTQITTDTRTCHKGGRGPTTLTGPYPIAPRQRGSPHTRVSGGHGLRTNAISLNIPSVMQRWVGGHHASATAQTGLMTPEGRR